jgi:hypothetical protein
MNVLVNEHNTSIRRPALESGAPGGRRPIMCGCEYEIDPSLSTTAILDGRLAAGAHYGPMDQFAGVAGKF